MVIPLMQTSVSSDGSGYGLGIIILGLVIFDTAGTYGGGSWSILGKSDSKKIL